MTRRTSRCAAASVVALVLALGCGASGDGGTVAGAGGFAGTAGASGTAGAGAGGTSGTGGGSGGSGNVLINSDAAGGASSGGSGGSAATTGNDGGAAAAPGCPGAIDTPVPEVCGNGLDDDLNGFIDEGCSCSIGQTQPCFGGQPSEATKAECHLGMQTCTGTAEFPGWGDCDGWGCGPTPPPAEICENGVDDDCDGQIDEGCDLAVPVDIDGDCVTASCPPQAPHPVGCMITMSGGDPRGCIANSGGALVYFQEGDRCGAGHVSGTLYCSSQPGGAPLGESNCAINKSTKFYAPTPAGCPATS